MGVGKRLCCVFGAVVTRNTVVREYCNSDTIYFLGNTVARRHNSLEDSVAPSEYCGEYCRATSLLTDIDQYRTIYFDVIVNLLVYSHIVYLLTLHYLFTMFIYLLFLTCLLFITYFTLFIYLLFILLLFITYFTLFIYLLFIYLLFIYILFYSLIFIYCLFTYCLLTYCL